MKDKIISKQLFVIGLLFSLTYIATLSSSAVNNNYWDSMISVLIAFIINILLCFPIFVYSKSEVSLQEKISENKFLLVLYLVYFIVADTIALVQLEDLFLNTIFPDVAPVFLGGLIVVVSVYAAYKGIETVARTSYFVVIFAVVSLVVIFLGTINHFDYSNREVFFYTGYSDTIKNSVIFFGRGTFLPHLAVLYFCVKDKIKIKDYIITQICVSFIAVAFFFVVTTTLGRFAQTQVYPMVTLFSVTGIKPLEKLDFMFSVVWLMIYTIRFSVTLLAIKALLLKSGVNKKAKWVVPICGLFILGLCLYLLGLNQKLISEVQFFLFILAIFLGTAVPVYYYAVEKNNNKL